MRPAGVKTYGTPVLATSADVDSKTGARAFLLATTRSCMTQILDLALPGQNSAHVQLIGQSRPVSRSVEAAREAVHNSEVSGYRASAFVV